MTGKPATALILAFAIAFPAAAAQQPRAPAPAAVPAHPHRLIPPSAADAAREAAPAGRLPIAQQDNLAFGVGMFSVTGHFIRDRGSRGREPMIDTTGRQNRVAAVGFSLRF